MDVQNLFAQVEVGLLDAAELLKFGNAKIEPKVGGYELYLLLGGVFGDSQDAGDLTLIFFFGFLGLACRALDPFFLNFFKLRGVVRNLFTNTAFVKPDVCLLYTSFDFSPRLLCSYATHATCPLP